MEGGLTMVQISNADAAIILALLQRGQAFYRNHAVQSRDQNDARLMAKMAKKMSKYCEPEARTNNNKTKQQ